MGNCYGCQKEEGTDYRRLTDTESNDSSEQDQYEQVRPDNEMTLLIKKLQESDREKSRLQRENTKLQDRYQNLEKMIHKLKEEKEEALNRLSALMGNKLRDNNPEITNLNDPNRPMKLGDQFSELYENEWTDTFTELTEVNSLSEKDTIAILIDMLKEISQRCKQEVEEQLSEMRKAQDNADSVDDGTFSKWKDILKSNAAGHIQQLTTKITTSSDFKTVTTYQDRSLPFIKKCTQICYYAELQDPSMFINFEPGQEFDKQLFKEYTQSGTKVDYLVWPAFHLHKDGPLMTKGVVQPKVS